MKISIVGAGFSGLTLAHFLAERGVDVEIFEKASAVGGLLHTKQEPQGLVETAANGLWNTALVEKLFRDLEINAAERLPQRKNRFIFRGRPKKWPLTVFESIAFAFRFCKNWLLRSLMPEDHETIAEWARRNGGEKFLNFMLAPGLQGIYAGDVSRMSAKLILSRFFDGNKTRPPKSKGTVAPKNGMGELIGKLTESLKERGVRFQTAPRLDPTNGESNETRFNVNSLLSSASLLNPVVLATSAWDAARLLEGSDPLTADAISKIESLPLVSVTLFFDDVPEKYRGFGCLFPRSEKFHALGVLFNTDIFGERAQRRSETWILGGAFHREITSLSDERIGEKIREDRKRLFKDQEPTGIVVTRWPKALPHYTLEMKEILKHLQPKSGIYLTGNYLGAIGLSRILEFNERLAEKIARDLGA
jgi:protoporphyrinogen/coproporphyrinogen III oxidase